LASQWLVPCDFIAFDHSLALLGRHHSILLANVFAPASAQAFGKTAPAVAARARQMGGCRIGFFNPKSAPVGPNCGGVSPHGQTKPICAFFTQAQALRETNI